MTLGLPRLAAWLLFAALIALLAGRVHGLLVDRRGDVEAADTLSSRMARVEARGRDLTRELARLADQAAALEDASACLRGDRSALARLFRSLEGLGAGEESGPALAVRTSAGSVLAWTGRTSEIRGLPAPVASRSSVFVLAGSVTTTLVAGAPVRGPDGTVVGLATAELPVRVQRNIRNDYLQDFDRIADAATAAEVHYRDVRDEAPDPFLALPPGVLAREASLPAPDGTVLAAIRVAAPPRAEVLRRLADRYHRLAAGLLILAAVFWAAGRPSVLALATGAVAARVVPLVLGWPVPASARILSSRLYSSSLFFPLLGSPLDLLATALLALVLSALLLERALAHAPEDPRPARAVAAAFLALLLLAGVFAGIADVSARAALDLDSIALLPRSPVHAMVHTALLAVIATGLLLLTALVVLTGPLPARIAPRIVYLGLLVLVVAALAGWPRPLFNVPPFPALALLGIAAFAGWTRMRWQQALRAASPEARAGLVVLGGGLLALLLFPTLAVFADNATRGEIERRDAALLVGQAQRRAIALSATRDSIDRSMLLEDVPPGPAPPGVEELAFSVWSATALAAGGFSSAVELQDPRGAVISRFALNLPSLAIAGPPRPLPPGEDWQLSRERLTLASAERDVLHARRRLVYHGEVHGAVHVYVAEDFWSLPFVPGRDPYSTLFRPSGEGGGKARTVALLVYDANGRISFSSAERALALPPDLLARVRREPRGFWTALVLADQPSHVFLFADGPALYGLGYPQRAPSRFVADLVEAFVGVSLQALVALFLVLLVRSTLGRRTLSFSSLYDAVRRRFSLRLFVAFIAVAVIPVVVLEIVVRRFVTERLRRESADQARERAAVAKKAVEDFAFFQRGESPGQEPVTDAALVWAASLIRNDLDVFDRGRLLASSKREVYASGLLLPRAPGAVYSALVLDELPAALRPERIGGFSTLVVSVPVRLGGLEPGLLSIPLALRQREEEAALEELDRTIRLGTFAFLVVAALLGQSIARRISDPIRDLTRATRRIAEGDLEARVRTESRDELRALVDSFNQMAGDLERQRGDLEKSNRLAAWAEMARQVAHEVKNPLTPIQLSAEHLRRVFGDPGVDFGATLNACTETILKQVRTLRRIVTEFSTFARPPAPAAGALDLGELVSEAIAPYRTVLPPGVELGLELPPGLPLVSGDRRLLERAVLNLLENALQAVGERGTIRVTTRAVDGRLEVEIEDSGPGLDPEARKRIFEPFFSTKTGGTGLGLALVKKTAQDHGGGVRLDSPAGGRTRAVLWLPTSEAAPPR